MVRYCYKDLKTGKKSGEREPEGRGKNQMIQIMLDEMPEKWKNKKVVGIMRIKNEKGMTLEETIYVYKK